MRILFLNHNLREHGTFFRAFHLARELATFGHGVTLVTQSLDHWYRMREEALDGVRIIETPSWNPVVARDDGWGPLDIAVRLGIVLREPFDLLYVFAHPPNVYLPMRFAQALRRKPVAVDWCDVYRDGIFPLREEIRAYRHEAGWKLAVQRGCERIESRLERRIVRKADGVTVISKNLADAARNAGVSEGRLLHYPSGANLDAIAPRDKSECRKSLGIEHSGPLLGYIANYNPDERFFLASLARAMRRHPNAQLLSAAPPFTPSLVKQNGLEGHLIELGRLPFAKMTDVLGASDLLLLPLERNASNVGRWPNKFGDYLAAGRPIVTNRVGDVPDYFPPEDSPEAIGSVSDPDPEAFGEAIADLLDQPERWDVMGASARHIAETQLDWNVLARRVDVFLRDLYRFSKKP
jgi:glycosyltransferase involved in cell wall biosynthesis